MFDWHSVNFLVIYYSNLFILCSISNWVVSSLLLLQVEVELQFLVMC